MSELVPELAALGPAPYLAQVLVLAATSQVLAWWLKVPSILLLLVTGFGLGQLVRPDEVLGRDLLFAGVSRSPVAHLNDRRRGCSAGP